MKMLYLIRGVSGSGKSTFANNLLDLYINSGYNVVWAEADHEMIKWNSETQKLEYNWSVDKLKLAHSNCYEKTKDFMNVCRTNGVMIVSNTFTTEKELQPYIDLAEKYGYQVTTLIVENRHGNQSVHNVPPHTIHRQRRKLQSSIKL